MPEAQAVYGRALRRAEVEPHQLDPFVPRQAGEPAPADHGGLSGEVGLYDEAEGEYPKALGLCPTFVDLFGRPGMMLAKKRGRAAAVRCHKEALMHNSCYAQALILLGAELDTP